MLPVYGKSKEHSPKQVMIKKLILAVVLLAIITVAIVIFILSQKDSVSDLGADSGFETTITLTDNTVSNQIGIAGGEVVLEGDNDIKSTLDISTDSLTSSTNISSTEIDSIEGFEEYFVAGIDIKPDGKTLLEGGTITFDLPEDVAANSLIAFKYSEDGKDFHFYPSKVVNNSVELQITGFSGFGLMESDAKDNENVKPEREKSKAENDLAKLLSDIQKKQLEDIQYEASPEELEAILDLLKEWYEKSVLPMAKAAEGNDKKLNAAISEFIAWRGMVQFYGNDIELAFEISTARESMAKGIDNAIEKAGERCKKNSDLTEIPKMTDWLKVAQSNGLEEYMRVTFGHIEELINECAQFKLSFTSVFTTTTNKGVIDIDTAGEATISFDADSGSFTGVGIYTIGGYYSDKFFCIPAAGAERRTLAIPFMSISFDEEKPDVTLVLELAEGNQSMLTYTCSGSGRTFSLQTPDPWISFFHDAHKGEYVGGGSGTGLGDQLQLTGQDYLIESWSPGDGVNFATKSYTEYSANQTTENSKFDLIHVPK